MNYLPIESVLAIATALLLSMALTRWMIHLGPKLGLMDQPDARRVHVTPIPRAGGIAIWTTFLLAAWSLRWFGPDSSGALGAHLLPFTVASTLLMAVGILDDRGGIRPLVKLAGQIAAALVFYVMHPKMNGVVFGYEVPVLLEIGVFVGWTVLLINAFNLIDGLDGLCGGLVCISLLVITGLQLAAGEKGDAVTMGLMVAAVVGFLRFNLNPARIFLGDAGSMMLGFFLATSATQVGGRRAVIGSIFLPLAIAGVPLLDVLLAIWRRSARNMVNRWKGDEGVGVFSPDKDHLHHRFLARGMNQRKVAMVLQALAGIFAALAFVPMLMGGKGVVVTICGLTLLGLFGLRHFAQVELIQTGSLIHMAVKRRYGAGRMRVWYFLYDLLCLGVAGAGSAMVAGLGVDGERSSLANVVVFTAVFTACQAVVLQTLRIYRRVWSRSAIREYILVAMGLTIGGMAAFSILTVAMVGTMATLFWACLLAVGLSTWLLLLPRALPEVMRELSVDSSHRHLTKRKNGGKQLLVYGAGDLGNLFAKYLKTCRPHDFDGFQISGYLDDSETLKGRTINGFRIIGGLNTLESLCREYPIHGVLVAIQDMPRERREQLLAESSRLGLAVYEWTVNLQPSRILVGSVMPVDAVEAGFPSSAAIPLMPVISSGA